MNEKNAVAIAAAIGLFSFCWLGIMRDPSGSIPVVVLAYAVTGALTGIIGFWIGRELRRILW